MWMFSPKLLAEMLGRIQNSQWRGDYKRDNLEGLNPPYTVPTQSHPVPQIFRGAQGSGSQPPDASASPGGDTVWAVP